MDLTYISQENKFCNTDRNKESHLRNKKIAFLFQGCYNFLVKFLS